MIVNGFDWPLISGSGLSSLIPHSPNTRPPPPSPPRAFPTSLFTPPTTAFYPSHLLVSFICSPSDNTGGTSVRGAAALGNPRTHHRRHAAGSTAPRPRGSCLARRALTARSASCTLQRTHSRTLPAPTGLPLPGAPSRVAAQRRDGCLPGERAEKGPGDVNEPSGKTGASRCTVKGRRPAPRGHPLWLTC